MGDKPVPYKDVKWALEDYVQVTLISHDPEGVRTIYLVTRIDFSWAGHRRVSPYVMPWDHSLVLDFPGDSLLLLINGQFMLEATESEELLKWATLTDAVSLSPHFPAPGTCVTTRWEG